MSKNKANSKANYAVDSLGYYGIYGGRYAPEVLMPALLELEDCYKKAKRDGKFKKELADVYRCFVGRPTPLNYCESLTKKLGGAKIFVKNEGLAHTGAHKINHCVGQALLAKRMNKKRIVAETGAGQHGVATAAVCAKFGFECVVYMGAIDMARQRPNVFWMEQLGATVIPVHHGGKRLKDAVNQTLKDWITNVETTHYLLGSAVGPHPFPEINRYFQTVVGKEIKKQHQAAAGKLPDYIIACVGGGSNAIGAFTPFLKENSVKLIGVEAGGLGVKSGKHAVRFGQGSATGRVGVVEGFKSYWLQDDCGQISDTYSICAGLDYAGVGPLHASLHDQGRVEYVSATDKEVLSAVKLLASTEGIIPALESAHAIAHAVKIAPKLGRNKSIVVNLSGRGDKDLFILAKALKDKAFYSFLKSFLDEQ
jgi:tryptophan synthase beta chain